MTTTKADIRQLMNELGGEPYTLNITQDKHLDIAERESHLDKMMTTLPNHYERVHLTLAEDLGVRVDELPPRMAKAQMNLSTAQTGGSGFKEKVDADDLMLMGNKLYRLYWKHKGEEPDKEGFEWWTNEMDVWLEREFVKGIQKG